MALILGCNLRPVLGFLPSMSKNLATFTPTELISFILPTVGHDIDYQRELAYGLIPRNYSVITDKKDYSKIHINFKGI